nr:hypothetical protein [Brucella gallinifaecis]
MNMNLGDIRLLIEAGRERGLLRNQMAYVLATAYHETAHTMKPINEMGVKSILDQRNTGLISGVDTFKSPGR